MAERAIRDRAWVRKQADAWHKAFVELLAALIDWQMVRRRQARVPANNDQALFQAVAALRDAEDALDAAVNRLVLLTFGADLERRRNQGGTDGCHQTDPDEPDQSAGLEARGAAASAAARDPGQVRQDRPGH